MRHRNPACNYAQIPNDAMRDELLTIEARGLLALLMTYADEWNFSKKHLMRVSGMGRDRFEKTMNELRDAGYIELQPARDERGRLCGHKWLIRDSSNRSPEIQGDGEVTEALKNRVSAEPRDGGTDTIRRPTDQEDQGEEETQTLFMAKKSKRSTKQKQPDPQAPEPEKEETLAQRRDRLLGRGYTNEVVQ